MTDTNFTNPQAVQVIGYPAGGSLMEPFITKDGNGLFFNSDDPNKDMFWATRITDTSFQFKGVINGVNAADAECSASMDSSGKFYVSTTRSLFTNRLVIYKGQFSNGTVSGLAAVKGLLRPGVPGTWTMDGEISADGKTMYFSDNTGTPPTTSTLAIASRNTNGVFARLSNSDQLCANLNAGGVFVYAPAVSADELEIFYNVTDFAAGTMQIFTAARASKPAAFGVPQLVAEATGLVEGACLSPDGHRLYFHQRQPADRWGLMMLSRDKYRDSGIAGRVRH